MTYCWYRSDQSDTKLNGPFVTVKEALTDVLDCFLPREDAPIAVAEIEEIRPEEYANVIDVDEVLEYMDEAVQDEIRTDDPVFDVPASRRAEAEAALVKVLATWAEQYVDVDGTWTAGNVVQETTVQATRIALAITAAE